MKSWSSGEEGKSTIIDKRCRLVVCYSLADRMVLGVDRGPWLYPANPCHPFRFPAAAHTLLWTVPRIAQYLFATPLAKRVHSSRCYHRKEIAIEGHIALVAILVHLLRICSRLFRVDLLPNRSHFALCRRSTLCKHSPTANCKRRKVREAEDR